MQLIPPKVLKGVLENGAFCDDELAAEYYGGVLASSRSEVGRDDRGAALVSLLERLTSYQVRTHFFFYTMVKTLYDDIKDVTIGTSQGRLQLQTFVPFGAYVAAMEFSAKEKVLPILSHVMFGLSGEALIENLFFYGQGDELKQQYSGAVEPGILFAPSARGVELFLWAHGHGDHTIYDFLRADLEFRSGVQIKATPGIRSTRFVERRLAAQGCRTVADLSLRALSD